MSNCVYAGLDTSIAVPGPPLPVVPVLLPGGFAISARLQGLDGVPNLPFTMPMPTVTIPEPPAAPEGFPISASLQGLDGVPSLGFSLPFPGLNIPDPPEPPGIPAPSCPLDP